MNPISIIVRASHALALSHWARAERAWATKQIQQAGSELKAAARHAEQAASWLGAEAGVKGDTLLPGTAWTPGEISHASLVVGTAIDAIGIQIGSPHKAGPFDGWCYSGNSLEIAPESPVRTIAR